MHKGGRLQLLPGTSRYPMMAEHLSYDRSQYAEGVLTYGVVVLADEEECNDLSDQYHSSSVQVIINHVTS